MNPFHLWLGLPEKSANPNHYQLLGIKSSELDPKAIERAAHEQLARLKRVTPNPDQREAFDKIKQRILKAHATLVDDKKRSQYDARLRAKLAQVKQEKKASASRPDAESEPPKPPPIPATFPSPEILAAEPVVAVPAEDSGPDGPEIPMAVPIQSAPPQPLAETQPQAEAPGPDGFSLTNAARAPDDLSVIKTKLKRRKKSWLVPIFCLVLCLGGIGGLVYLVTHFDAIVGNRAPVSPITETEQPQFENESKIENVPDENEVDPTNTDPKVIPSNLSTAEATEKQPDDLSNPTNITYEKLDFDQLVQFRRHMENARRALYRRETQNAQNEIQNAQALFTRFERDDLALDKSQIPLQQMADSAGEIKSLVEGFWQQVVSSTVAIPGGQPLEVAGKTLGFVEGNQQYVILRIEGRNATIAYELLAPGIAMALAEQGAKRDVPTFRMQQAAFYAVHTHLDPKYRERAMDFAKQAAKDGHDPAPIENFVDFDTVAVGVPDERIPQPPPAEMKEKIPKLMNSLGIVGFRKMRPEQAANAIDLTMEAAVVDNDAFRKAMSFEAAYRLAVKAGDIRKVNDVLDEYHVWFDYNFAERANQALLDVAKQPLDPRTARFLLSAMIDKAETSEDQRYLKQLVTAGQKVADRHNLAELLRRLELAAN